MNKIQFTYKDFDTLEDYRDAIGKFWSDGPLTLERTEQVMEHLGIYRELKGLTKPTIEERRKRMQALIDAEENPITKKNMEMIFNL